ncbi:polypeptide N-acetylgalactosaminyltransferase 12 isoform X2 [Bubalus kerabau]|uniref:polypeptide N-acetylgalactosaminyltransferase 12 isoform X2 n=1 Tax=Bubalus carabanensis TaxID=3119969 RepID=UPI00244E9FA2|nr:polypeptide N-acetylgalactosaminyltransferase 12 isoform X2 [Bubalus carabanensis]
MLGRAARRRCPRGLRRGREALLALLALLALAGLASVLRARRGAGAAEPGLRRTQRSGRRDPVLPRPPVPEDALGAHGEAVRLQLQGEELRLQEESVRLHQINIYLSDRISLHRRLPERWNPLCKEKKYNYDELPTTSVVIAFYNEAWSTLLRTVYSVLETSPDTLLEEVILVDDYSDREHLKERLATELAGLPKVRLIRANKREGLVRARLLGASVAKGGVLTFLDCHCECHEGWLEPLLQRIHEKESAVVCPVIDVIDWNTFEYLGNAGEPQIGGFDWRLVFTWHTVPEKERIRMRSPIDVIRSPTMAGGLFAVSKKYFEYLGSYDIGMEVWGGENLEFSFRLQNKGLRDYCFDYNPPNEHEITGHQVILYRCHGMGQNQFFEYTSQNEIRYNTHQPEGCVAVVEGTDVLIMHLCENTTPEDQKFILQEDGSLFHVPSKKCVQAERKDLSDSFVPLLRDCTNSDHQKWFFREHIV